MEERVNGLLGISQGRTKQDAKEEYRVRLYALETQQKEGNCGEVKSYVVVIFL